MERNQNTTDPWNANLYDSHHSFVSNLGADMLELLAPQKGELILDLGCGTGDLANKIYERGAQVIGVDQSENMILQAKEKYPQIPFYVFDVLELPFSKTYDAVFSNAVLHWVKKPKKALEHIFESLTTGGRFVAEFGGKGNVQMITNEIRNQFQAAGLRFEEEQFPWFFPSIGEYTSMMEEVGFHVSFAYHFDRPTPLKGENGLRNWIDMFATSIFTGVDGKTKNAMIENIEQNLKDTMFQAGIWTADYKRIRVIGQKN